MIKRVTTMQIKHPKKKEIIKYAAPPTGHINSNIKINPNPNININLT